MVEMLSQMLQIQFLYILSLVIHLGSYWTHFAFDMIFPTTFMGHLLLLEFRALRLSGFYTMGICGEHKLLLGELGELWDAEECWNNGDGNEENICAHWS